MLQFVCDGKVLVVTKVRLVVEYVRDALWIVNGRKKNGLHLGYVLWWYLSTKEAVDELCWNLTFTFL